MMKLPLLSARRSGGRPVRFPHAARLGVAVVLGITCVVGCSSPDSYDNTSATEQAVTFSGPRHLYGSIGSYGSFINNRPRYVGGYGMVVDLNATGSNEVPSFLRDWLVTEMRRNNLGSTQFGTERFSPERVMADLGSSVVAVEGLIPPGARQGAKFDLLVTMIDQTSTSLAGGRLFWPAQLSSTGLDESLAYTETQATGYGELFVNPVADTEAASTEFLRQAVVVNGGTVLVPQRVQFVLNQPSYRVSNAIAERINARFEALDTDNLPTAVAKNDALIEINVPERFAGQPEELLALIEHLYLDPTPQFVRPQAELLGRALVADPASNARSVSLSWKTLGPNVMPVIRPYYTHENLDVRLAALEAGAWMQDKESITPLIDLATRGDAGMRVRAARALVIMPRHNDARQHVRSMLNDPDAEVRFGAYEALVMVRDRAINRASVADDVQHKYYIDRVPSDYPAVYAVQGDDQAIVIFGGDIPFRNSVFAKIDDALIVQTLPVQSIQVGLSGRYEGDSAFVPIHRCGALEMIPSLTPVSDDPDAKLPDPDWRVEVGDDQGGAMLINIRDPQLQDAFGAALLSVPGRDTPSDEPRAIAMLRVVKPAGRDDRGNPTPAVGELIQLRDPRAPMPLALRYLKPGDREPKIYRVAPTAATMAYTLGYWRGEHVTQLGPNLRFSQVAHAMHALCEQGQIPAPFEARFNPIAQAILTAQEQTQTEARPEFTPEDMERLEQDGSTSPLAPGGSATGPAGQE